MSERQTAPPVEDFKDNIPFDTGSPQAAPSVEELAVLTEAKREKPKRKPIAEMTYEELHEATKKAKDEAARLNEKARRKLSFKDRMETLFLKADALGDVAGREFPPLRWIVPNLLPRGTFALLSGSTKIGKSWLVLQLASAVSLGIGFLGNHNYICEQSEVLFLSLQLPPRTLHNRMEKAGIPADNRVRILYSFPGGEEALRAVRIWKDRYPECQLVIIDMLEQVRIRDPQNPENYSLNTKELAKWSKLAQELDIGIIGLTHNKKATSADFVNDLIGSIGQVGSSGAVWSLKRSSGDADAILYSTGWDIEDVELPLAFGETAWQLLEGTVAEYKQSRERRDLLAMLANVSDAVGARDLAEMLEKKVGTVRYLLCMLKKEGQVECPTRGKYRIST